MLSINRLATIQQTQKLKCTTPWQNGDLINLYQILKVTYNIDNQLFTSSTSTTTRIRCHTMKLFHFDSQ